MKAVSETGNAVTTQARVYIGRQVIIDREKKVVGYELLYRHTADATKASFDDNIAASSEVLSSLLTQIGMKTLLGGDNLAFINVSAAMLDNDLIDLLPPTRVVLEILGATAQPATIARCRDLRARGFRLALDNILPVAANSPLLEVADYVKLDIQSFAPGTIARAVAALRARPLQLIAEKVETPAEFDRCRKLGFNAFQGFHFAHPETVSARAINPGLARVVELLNMIRDNADFSRIEAALKCDVALAIRLLRYINSVGFGLSSQVRSINHALALLGYRQLYRWLSLLLLSADGDTGNQALAKTALARGRLTELLGQDRLEGCERDNLFIAGLFSLIDAILEVPMTQAVEAVSLPENILEALLHRSGIYGIFLKLAEACEGDDWASIDTLAQTIGLSPAEVNEANLRAVAWAEELEL